MGLAWKQDVNIVELFFGGNRLQRTSSDVGGRFLQQIILHVVENKQIAWVVWSMPGSSARVFSLQRAYPPFISIWFSQRYERCICNQAGSSSRSMQGRQWNSCMSAWRVEGVQAQYSCGGKDLHQATPLAVEHFKTIHQALHSDSERCGY